MPVIEKNVPLPENNGTKQQPHLFLNLMEVGDSVLITADEYNLHTMRSSIRMRNMRARKGEGPLPWSFVWAREEGYPKNDTQGAIRVWRIK